MSNEMVDARTKLDEETHRILDAIALATGRDKSAIIREVMAVWCKEEVHKATLLLRMVERKGIDGA